MSTLGTFAMRGEALTDSHVLVNAAEPASKKQPFSWQDAEPIGEGQFKALVRKFDRYPALEGIVYEREGYPWRFIRLDSHVRAVYKSFLLPEKHYIIV